MNNSKYNNKQKYLMIKNKIINKIKKLLLVIKNNNYKKKQK